jgi:hypothetical protein
MNYYIEKRTGEAAMQGAHTELFLQSLKAEFLSRVRNLSKQSRQEYRDLVLL